METVLWGIALLKHSNHEFSGLYLLEPAFFEYKTAYGKRIDCLNAIKK